MVGNLTKNQLPRDADWVSRDFVQSLSNALGNIVEDRSDLDSAFKALGMDTGMIGQFAPLILQYLGQQGIAGSLLQNLGSLWTTPAPATRPSV